MRFYATEIELDAGILHNTEKILVCEGKIIKTKKFPFKKYLVETKFVKDYGFAKEVVTRVLWIKKNQIIKG